MRCIRRRYSGVGRIIGKQGYFDDCHRGQVRLRARKKGELKANIYEFADIIRTFKSTSAHKEMTITARIESFTVRRLQCEKRRG